MNINGMNKTWKAINQFKYSLHKTDSSIHGWTRKTCLDYKYLSNLVRLAY